MYFDFNISVTAIALLSASLAGLLYILLVYLRRMTLVRRRIARCNATDDTATGCPGASVVVYAMGDADTLRDMLADVCSQQMPRPYDVVVVGDGDTEDYAMVVSTMRLQYPNLYYTYIPEGSRVLSRRKLALTLGVKASKGDVVVITDSTVRVPSAHWLARMVSPFADPSIEVVIGYNAHHIPRRRWAGRLIRAYDSVADDVAWLSAAVGGRPYRGCGSNIAYRRDLFFRHKGFSASLNLKHGDDDLFVNEITTRHNTYVQLADDAIGTEGHGMSVGKRLKRRRHIHAFTGRLLPKLSRRLMATGDWLMWGVPALAVAGACAAGVTNGFGWVVAGVIIVALVATMMVAWRMTTRAMHAPTICVLAPVLSATRPLRNIAVAIASRTRAAENYTWQ